MPTVDTPRITLTGSMPAITVNVVTGTSGGGTSVHNQLTGRSADDAHPISAITGLQEALDESAGGAVASVNGETGTVVLTAADVGAIATSARGNSNGVASLDGDGTVPDIQLPSSIARDSEIGTQITAHDGSGTAHSTQFAGKANASHTHAASDIVSGQFATARVASGTATEGHVPTVDGSGNLVLGAPTSGTTLQVYLLSLESTLETGNGQMRLPVTSACTITKIRAMVGSAPSGASVIADVNKNGTTVFTTQANRPTIAAAGTDSGVEVPDVTALVAGDYLTLDVDQIGSGSAGSDLVVAVEVSVP